MRRTQGEGPLEGGDRRLKSQLGLAASQVEPNGRLLHGDRSFIDRSTQALTGQSVVTSFDQRGPGPGQSTGQFQVSRGLGSQEMLNNQRLVGADPREVFGAARVELRTSGRRDVL